MQTIYFSLLLIIIAIVLIGFFAGMEMAFLTANRLNIELQKKQGKKNGIILSKFLQEPAKFIGSCLIGLNFFLVIYGLLLSSILRPLWSYLNISNSYIPLVADTLLSTIIILVLGEFIPKAIFRAKNDLLISLLAKPAHFFYKVFYPVVSVLVFAAEWILKYILNIRVTGVSQPFGKVDLEHFFQQNKLPDDETAALNSELFENALSLPMTKIRQCLIPRTEIEAVELNTPIIEARKRMMESKLSKLVIFENSIDNIIGYVHQLDMFKHPQNIQSILLPIPVVPETMNVTDLINKFSLERKSIAWVIDEFGGTAGIITMEDVLEEIFGEIKDEYDNEEFTEKVISQDEYILSGRLETDYLKEKYGLRFSVTDSETLSGFIISKNEAIPKLKERIIIDMFEFEILGVSDTRIEMVKLKVLK